MVNRKPTPAQAQEKLTELGLKITHPRIVIYNALLNLKDHPTAEIIYKSIHKQNPSISLGTVYKTLETFVNIGLINKVKSAEDKVRYDIRTDNHHHLYCLRSDRVIDFYDEEVKDLIEKFFRKNHIHNFRIDDIQLQISGEVLDDKVEDFHLEASGTENKEKAGEQEKNKNKKTPPAQTPIPPNQLSIL